MIKFCPGIGQRCTFPKKSRRWSTTITTFLYCTGYVDIITELIHILSGRMIKSFDSMRLYATEPAPCKSFRGFWPVLTKKLKQCSGRQAHCTAVGRLIPSWNGCGDRYAGKRNVANFNSIKDVVWQLQRGVLKLGGIVKASGIYTSHMQITACENPVDSLYILTRALESDLRGCQCPHRNQVKSGLNTYANLGR